MVLGDPSLWRLSVDGDSAAILIVDDDEAIASMYRLQLEMDGYAVHVVGSVAEAKLRVSANRPDLLLLDIGLPGADGFELLQWRRSEGHGFPVLLLSNYSNPELVARARELGVSDYLVKSNTTPIELTRAAAAILSDSR